MILLPSSTVIVTGASMGIGHAVAVALAGMGCRLVLNARGEEKLLAVAGECRGLGAEVQAVPGSVGLDRTARKLARAAFASDRVFGFIHAAGVLHPGPALWEIPVRSFGVVMEASVTGALQLVRRVVPELRRRGGGTAVFFGSGAAEMSIPGLAAYCAAKAAEESLARTLAAEAPEMASIVFRPGVVDTRMHRQAREAEGSMAASVRADFKAIKERGDLVPPAQAARSLLRILSSDPMRYSGRIARAGD